MDPETARFSRRSRLKKAILKSMLTSGVFGVCGYLVGLVGVMFAAKSAVNIHAGALTAGLNTTAVVFWILCPVLVLYEYLKSDAVLDLERRCRLAEELFKRGPSTPAPRTLLRR
jgi:hypothetical protein